MGFPIEKCHFNLLRLSYFGKELCGDYYLQNKLRGLTAKPRSNALLSYCCLTDRLFYYLDVNE